MTKKMTIWGIGWTLVLTGVPFAVVIGYLNSRFLPNLRLSFLPQAAAWIAGGILILCGVAMLFMSAGAVRKAFREGMLVTSGVFSLIRNPIYCAWIVLILPGIVLISRSVLLWLVPALMYVVFKMLIKKEDGFLEERFGDEYRQYRAKTGELFPRLRR